MTPRSPTSLPFHAARSTELPPYALKAGAGKEADQHDAALASILARLAEHRRRRTLLLAFAQSPVDFIHAMTAAQVGGVALKLLCLLSGVWDAAMEGSHAPHAPPIGSRSCSTPISPACHTLPSRQARELRSSAARDGEAFELMPSGDVFKDRWVDNVVSWLS